MKTLLTDDNVTLHYRREGTGRPIVLLHGWTASHRDWQPLIPLLTPRHSVIRWDARGHGFHAIAAQANMSLDRLVDDLAFLLESEDIRDATLVGHSMGALISWRYCERYGSERLNALCILDQSPKLITDNHWDLGIYGNFTADDNRDFIARLSESFAEGVLELTAFGLNAKTKHSYLADSRGIQRVRAALQLLHSAPLTRLWQSLTDADLRASITGLDVPALLVYGDNSQFYNQRLIDFVHDKTPLSQLEIYAGADHSPHLADPQRFANDLLTFIRNKAAHRVA